MLTVTMITKNEAANLRRTLQAIQQYKTKPNSLVTEILILDTESQDDTEKIAREFGVSWHVASWHGFGPQKQKTTALAKNDWVLNLDADEVPTPEFWNGLESYFKNRAENSYAALIRRDTVFLGKQLQYGGAADQKKIRLFHRKHFNWNDKQTHEDVVPLAEMSRVDVINGKILHYSWPNTSAALMTLNRYAGEISNIKFHKARSGVSLFFNIYLRFFAEFFRGFVLRLGFLDGVPGFAFCFLMAFSHELKFIKLYEIANTLKTAVRVEPTQTSPQ